MAGCKTAGPLLTWYTSAPEYVANDGTKGGFKGSSDGKTLFFLPYSKSAGLSCLSPADIQKLFTWVSNECQ